MSSATNVLEVSEVFTFFFVPKNIGSGLLNKKRSWKRGRDSEENIQCQCWSGFNVSHIHIVTCARMSTLLEWAIVKFGYSPLVHVSFITMGSLMIMVLSPQDIFDRLLGVTSLSTIIRQQERAHEKKKWCPFKWRLATHRPCNKSRQTNAIYSTFSYWNRKFLLVALKIDGWNGLSWIER